MSRLNLTDLIESGAHFGHLTRRWNPKNEKIYFHGKKRDSHNRPEKNPESYR